MRNTFFENHFLELGGNKAMILGCHDLTIFNPRSDAKATSWRLDVKQRFKELAAEYKPRWVLHALSRLIDTVYSDIKARVENG